MAQTFMFADDGVVPNNPVLPVVVIAGTGINNATEAHAKLHVNGWGGTWENTVFDYTHYHPDAHEVLICVEGWADIKIGGENGREFRLTPGDCIVLPAGTGHCSMIMSPEFSVVGGYPKGQENPEIRRASKENHAGSPERIAGVGLPTTCPISGVDGQTLKAWTDRYNEGTAHGA